jgi:nitroimidazol reductase NimA-like FMN-containing flavoprotein (pyridoxamine 5'-phosphate oxidase superfamily)
VAEHSNSPVAEPYAGDGAPTAPWDDALEELGRAFTFWVATVHPSGRPHVVPVLAVVCGDVPHFAAGPGTQKARNLARDPRVTVTTHGGDFDVVVEGVVHAVDADDDLAAVADAYVHKYGWEVEARKGSLHGDGAPTAGPPPYDVYRLTPHRAFGFPATGNAAPTRWVFPSPARP